MQNILEGLNPQQYQAAEHVAGPIMVMAGAGSGKTRVLTHRIAHLIFNLGIPRDSILAITFTNKAASEMKERIRSMMPQVSTYSMWISTFHAMCARILRDHAERLGYKKTFQIIDDDDVLQMIKALMKQNQYDVKLYKPSSVKTMVLHYKNDASVLDEMHEPLKSVVEQLTPVYIRKLKDNHLMDFDDLILNTIRLLENFPDVRTFYHQLFSYVHVDEFQDTNVTQYRLICLLLGEHHNLFVVGDEDQSIYAFRGASIENIARLKKDFPTLTLTVLEQNYRSTNTILKAANQVIQGNANRVEKNLFSTRGDGEKIVFYKGYSDRDEVEFVAETIRHKEREGIPYASMAVLYRANQMSRRFEESFIQKRIPYKIVGNVGFFRRKEIKDIVAYLRLVVNPHDDFSVMRVINEPRRGIGVTSMEKVVALADQHNTSIASMVFESIDLLPSAIQKKMVQFFDVLHRLSELFLTDPFDQFMDQLLTLTGYKTMLLEDEKGDVRMENILELTSMFEENTDQRLDAHPEMILTQLLEDIALKSAEDDNDDPNTVSLMTLHAAKGLEFDVIFLVGLEEGLFPSFQTLESERELAEERRLMYVGITRAKDHLYLTNAYQRMHYGQISQFRDSQFLDAIDADLIRLEGMNLEKQKNDARYARDYQQTAVYKEKKARLQSRTVNDIHSGDKVQHNVFGDGVVVTVLNEQCTIAFAKPYGIKTLMKDHPALSKV